MSDHRSILEENDPDIYAALLGEEQRHQKDRYRIGDDHLPKVEDRSREAKQTEEPEHPITQNEGEFVHVVGSEPMGKGGAADYSPGAAAVISRGVTGRLPVSTAPNSRMWRKRARFSQAVSLNVGSTSMARMR